jgi:glucose-1-phosphate thymidylyltransferase
MVQIESGLLMKAILMAGGSGSRLWPLSVAINKQLLPVYDKPMIYYPLTTLMLAGAKEILVVTNPESIGQMRNLLEDGNQWGIKISYAVQSEPKGIPEAFKLAPLEFQKFPVILMLGDNLLYGVGLGESLQLKTKEKGVSIFGYRVSNPADYGIIELDANSKPKSIVEKPRKTMSNLAIPGIYFFDSSVYERVKKLEPSPRGELEIVDLLTDYLLEGQLAVEILERGTAWLDTGSAQNLLAAGEFVRVIEERQGLKIGSPEEVSLRLGLISRERYIGNIKKMPNSAYRKYLEDLNY